MTGKAKWVKLYGQTLESDFWIDPAPFDHRSAFLYVLLAANWKPGKFRKSGHVLDVKRGQLLTSIRHLQDAFHWGSTDRVKRWLDLMQEYGMIEHESLPYGTLLTVVNYDRFQNEADSDKDTNKDSDGYTPKDTPKYTPKDSDKDKVGLQYKNKEYRTKNEETLLAPSVPTAVCEDAGTGEEDAEDDDEGYMTPDELRQFLESYYREHPIGNGSAECAVPAEG